MSTGGVQPDALRQHDGLLTRVGGMLSHDTAIYTVAMCLVFPFGLIQVAVLTRHIEPAGYGELALLLMFSGLLTIVMNLVTLQGTFMVTYGGGGEGGDDAGDIGDVGAFMDDEVGDNARAVDITRDRQLVLTTGLVLTTLVVAALALPLMAAAPAVSSLLLHRSSGADLVRWAVLSAAAGAYFRFFHNILRLERRVWIFSAGSLLRPALVVGMILVYLLTGHGVTGVLIGMVLGTAITALFCYGAAMNCYRIGFSRRYARHIYRKGLQSAYLQVAMYLMMTIDVFLLSRFASAHDVGVYRFASRLGSIPTFFVSAYTMSMLALDRTPIFQAAYALESARSIKSSMFSYFTVAALGIVVAMSIGADVLVRIAAPSYHQAAQLVPILVLAAVVSGTFIVILRSARVPNSMRLRIWLMSMALLLTSGLSIVLIPLLGSYGPPVVLIIAMGLADAVLLWRAATIEEPFRLQWRRIGLIFVAAVVSWAVGTKLAHLAGPMSLAVALLGIALFPVLVIASRAVPVERLALLRAIARSALPDRRGRRSLHLRLRTIPVRERAVIEDLARRKRTIEEVALEESISRREAIIRLTQGLGRVSGVEVPAESAVDLGEFVLLDGPNAAKYAFAGRIQDQGVDLYTAHLLHETFVTLRSSRRALWRATLDTPGLEVEMESLAMLRERPRAMGLWSGERLDAPASGVS